MKTTIDLPEALLHRAKVTAAQRSTTLKDLVVEGLKRVIQSPDAPGVESPTETTDDAFFEKDSYGVPVLKRRRATVTDALIEQIRKEEGI
jgi:hypothetical protein